MLLRNESKLWAAQLNPLVLNALVLYDADANLLPVVPLAISQKPCISINNSIGTCIDFGRQGGSAALGLTLKGLKCLAPRFLANNAHLALKADTCFRSEASPKI